jgi:hypothetical protein
MFTFTRFRAPFGAVVCGPTMSGKSEYVFTLIRERTKMFENPPSRIVYCYGEYQEGFTELQQDVPEIEFIKGLSNILDTDDFFSPSEPTLLILDDLGQEVANDTRSTKLFTQGIHHKKVSVILIMQNLYKQGRSMRDVHLNAQYLVLFKNVRDIGQISVLERQMGLPHLSEAYKQVTAEPYTPIILDMKPDTPDYLRVRSHVLPGQDVHIYTSKSAKIPQTCLSESVNLHRIS